MKETERKEKEIPMGLNWAGAYLFNRKHHIFCSPNWTLLQTHSKKHQTQEEEDMAFSPSEKNVSEATDWEMNLLPKLSCQ